MLDREDGVAETVRRHLGRVEQQLGALERLRLRLTRLLAALDGDEASTAQFLDAMEAMTMFEKYYTPEQLEQLEQRRQALGRRAGELVQMFTGGDPGIQASLQRMYEQEGPEKASRGMGSPEDFEYMAAIRAAAR